jgi:hypothetical protein
VRARFETDVGLTMKRSGTNVCIESRAGIQPTCGATFLISRFSNIVFFPFLLEHSIDSHVSIQVGARIPTCAYESLLIAIQDHWCPPLTELVSGDNRRYDGTLYTSGKTIRRHHNGQLGF